MAPPLAKDIGKATKDLIEKEFAVAEVKDKVSDKFDVEIKTRSSTGLENLVKFNHVGGALSSTAEHSYNYKPWNLGFKGTLKSKEAALESELSLSDLGLKGLKVTGTHDSAKNSWKGAFEFKNDVVAANGSYAQNGEIPFALVYQRDKLLAGVDFAFFTGKPAEKDPKPFFYKREVFCNYASGDANFTTRLALNAAGAPKKHALTVGYLHNVSSDVTVAGQVSANPLNTAALNPELTLVGSLKLDSATTVKGKVVVGAKQHVGVALAQKLSDNVKVTVGSSYVIGSPDSQRFAVLLNLNN